MHRCLRAILLIVVASQPLASIGEERESPAARSGVANPLPYAAEGTIAVAAESGGILAICVRPGGGLVAVAGPTERFGARTMRGRTRQPPAHRLVWFSADGTEERAMPLDFAATAVAAAPDGSIYAAGDGVVAHVSTEGEPISRASTPAGPQSAEERAEFERLVGERHESQIAALQKQAERMRDAMADAKKRLAKAEDFITAEEEAAQAEEESDGPANAETDRVVDRQAGADGDGGVDDGARDDEAEEAAAERRRRRESRLRVARSQASRIRTELRQMAPKLEQLEQPLRDLRKLEVRDIVEAALAKTRQVRAVSADRDAAFVVVPEASGYGYAVWRLDGRLENPTKIVSQLVGCCGQMDVQVFGDRLAIAANRKHCVDLVDFTGAAVGSVGQRASGRAADATGGFGGCCNPMNTCRAPDGSLLTSESDGTVKRFEADGTFVEVVGKAKVRAGCKNSAIAIEPDGSRLYYLDVEHGTVIILGTARRAGAGNASREAAESPRTS